MSNRHWFNQEEEDDDGDNEAVTLTLERGCGGAEIWAWWGEIGCEGRRIWERDPWRSRDRRDRRDRRERRRGRDLEFLGFGAWRRGIRGERWLHRRLLDRRDLRLLCSNALLLVVLYLLVFLLFFFLLPSSPPHKDEANELRAANVIDQLWIASGWWLGFYGWLTNLKFQQLKWKENFRLLPYF